MEKIIMSKIIDAVAPVVIPLPFCGEYRTKIKIEDCKDNMIIKITRPTEFSVNSFEIRKTIKVLDFLMETVFLPFESVIIFNNIIIDECCNQKRYKLIIDVVKANQHIDIVITTNSIDFIGLCIETYKNKALDNNMLGLSKELKDINERISEEPDLLSKTYLFKATRKSRL